MKKVILNVGMVLLAMGLLTACSKDDAQPQVMDDDSFNWNEWATNYVLPEAEKYISEEAFLKPFSNGEWHLYDVTNVMKDGTEVSRKKEEVNGTIKDVRLFAFIVGASPTSFSVTEGSHIREAGVSLADGKPAYYDGSFNYSESESLLTIQTKSATEVDGKHRLMSISDDELVISGRPYSPMAYPDAVYAIYVYHHEPFNWLEE